MDPGTTIDGKYRVERLLGKGAMGSVYQCRRVQDLEGHRVAVKVINPEHAADPRYRARFQQEAKALTNLVSDYAVKIHDGKCSGDGILYLVMELLEGRALDVELSEDGPLSLPRALIIVYQACEAVAEVHERGIIHRDLKPANLFVQSLTDKPGGRPHWRVKVLDFGIARLPEEGTASEPPESGFQPGTPGYMSPEQTRGEPVGPATDVWALGVILFELISGQKLWQGGLEQVCRGVLRDPPRSVRDLRPEVPKELDQIIHVCLEKEPSRRYPSVEVLGEKLRSLIQWLRRDPAWDEAFYTELRAQESLSARFASTGRRPSESPEPKSAGTSQQTLPTVDSPVSAPPEDADTTVASAPSASQHALPKLSSGPGPGGSRAQRLLSDPALPVSIPPTEQGARAFEIPGLRPRRRRLWGTGGIVAAVGVAIAIGVLSRGEGGPAQQVAGERKREAPKTVGSPPRIVDVQNAPTQLPDAGASVARASPVTSRVVVPVSPRRSPRGRRLLAVSRALQADPAPTDGDSGVATEMPRPQRSPADDPRLARRDTPGPPEGSPRANGQDPENNPNQAITAPEKRRTNTSVSKDRDNASGNRR
ncbi:MAG: protein kinase [Polyangiaceae bacterium]|nr:protein kinase [Polyangiaceae bacterium]